MIVSLDDVGVGNRNRAQILRHAQALRAAALRQIEKIREEYGDAHTAADWREALKERVELEMVTDVLGSFLSWAGPEWWGEEI